MTQAEEPRAYSNAPVCVNFLIAGYGYTRGGLAFDQSVPITDVSLHTSNAVVAFARVLDLWGESGKFDVIVPYTWLPGSATYVGEPVERVVDGFADPKFRLSVNLYGAPALTLKEFAAYTQDVIVGASLQVSVPLGQYDANRVVNIGTNRWWFKPEVGVSKATGPWTLEVTAAATLFTNNTDFYGGATRAQDPIYSFQGRPSRRRPWSSRWRASGFCVRPSVRVSTRGRSRRPTASRSPMSRWAAPPLRPSFTKLRGRTPSSCGLRRLREGGRP